MSTPVRHNVAKTHLSTGTGLSGRVNQDLYISQLIRHLEDLDLSSSVRAQKAFPSISTIHLSCCSPSESTSVQSQQQRATFRMIHRHPTASVRHVNSRLRSSTEHPRRGRRDGSSREPQLRVTPVQVARVSSGNMGRGGDERTAKTLCRGGSVDEGGRRSAGLKPNGCSTRADFNTDDSDLSDQEKGGAEVHGWATPAAQLRLRPEPFGSDPDVSVAVLPEADFPYEEVLPAPLNGLDLTKGLPSAADWEGEPSLAAIVNRLSEMAALQTATVQRELTRTARCRLATNASFTGSSPRLRKADFPESKSESAPTGRYGTVVSSLMKLSLTCDPCARRSGPACALYKQNRARVGTRPQPVFKRSRSSPTKLNSTEARGQSRGNGSAPKPRTGNKDRKIKANREGTFRSHREPPPNSAKKTKSSDLGKA